MSSSTDSDYVFVAKFDQLPMNTPSTFEVADRFVVVVKNEQGVFCIDDVCTHDGGTLSDGEIEGHCLVCPRHGAKFDIMTGKAMSMPATEPTTSHDVLVVDGNVLIRINAN